MGIWVERYINVVKQINKQSIAKDKINAQIKGSEKRQYKHKMIIVNIFVVIRVNDLVDISVLNFVEKPFKC